MQTIEKINGLFKSIRSGLSKTFKFLIKIKDLLWFLIVVIMALFLISQCDSKNKLEKEIDILTNNTYALTDSLHHYHDKLGNTVAEKHALQLSQEEMKKTIGELKKKNMEYISYMNSTIGVRDTVYIEKVIFNDVVIDTIEKTESGVIHLEKSDTFSKSKRYISADIPYKASYPSNLVIDNASFIVNQDIFVESTIARNNKTKETMLYLKTDYPGITFNSGNGIVPTNSKQYDKEMRKRQGVGLAIGPSFGVYYDSPTKSLKPAFGLTLTIGYTFTPKSFQW